MHMACRTMPFPMTYSNFEGHSPTTRLGLSYAIYVHVLMMYIRAAYDKISTDKVSCGPSATAELLVGA